MSDSALALSGIAKSFRRGEPNQIVVLRDVDLEIMPGEIVGLAAPSGSGKSTLLHIAGLLDEPDSGVVSVRGVSATGAPDRVRTSIRRNEIGFVYQFHHLLPEFSAIENVMLPQLANGRARSEARSTATNLLGSVGLSARIGHRPGELSGGEQQRVAICRALANEPKLLLADEPTGNLDPETAKMIFDVLMEMVRNQGMAALVATHNLELAKRVDRVVRIEHGEIV